MKPEATIISRITQNNAPPRTQCFYLVKSSFNESSTNTLPLLIRFYSDGPKTVPIDRLSVDLDR